MKYKFFKNIPKESKEKVIELFTTTNDNGLPTIELKMKSKLSYNHISRIVNEYLKVGGKNIG